MLGPIVGELMGTTLWEGVPVRTSCVSIAPTQVVQIVEWREAACRVGIVDPQPALQIDHPE